MQVFKAETGEKLLDIQAHEDEVLCCAFSSDDSYIATCSADRKVKVRCWSTGSGSRSTYRFCWAPGGLPTAPLPPTRGDPAHISDLCQTECSWCTSIHSGKILTEKIHWEKIKVGRHFLFELKSQLRIQRRVLGPVELELLDVFSLLNQVLGTSSVF